MFLGHNIIGLLNLNGSTERPFLRHRRPASHVSVVAGQGISLRMQAAPPTQSRPTTYFGAGFKPSYSEEEGSSPIGTCELHGDLRSSSRCTCHSGYVHYQWP